MTSKPTVIECSGEAPAYVNPDGGRVPLQDCTCTDWHWHLDCPVQAHKELAAMRRGGKKPRMKNEHVRDGLSGASETGQVERLRREHERQAQMERDLSRANSPSPAERMESPTWNHSKK